MGLAIVGLAAFLVQTNSPAKPLGTTAPADRVGAILSEWRKASARLHDVQFDFDVTWVDSTFGTKTNSKGRLILAQGNLFRVDLSDAEGRPNTTFVRTDKAFDFYLYAGRRVTHCPVDAGPETLKAEDLLTQFVRGLGDMGRPLLQRFVGRAPGDVTSDFDVKFEKEDNYYIYLDLVPRKAKRKTPWFLPMPTVAWMSIVLDKKTFLVRRVFTQEQYGNSILCMIKHIRVNAQPPATAASISQDLPKGWKRVSPAGNTTAEDHSK